MRVLSRSGFRRTLCLGFPKTLDRKRAPLPGRFLKLPPRNWKTYEATFFRVQGHPTLAGRCLGAFERRHFRLEDGMAASVKTKLAKARKYAQELRDLRRRLNIMPLQRIPYDIANTDARVPAKA